MEVDLRLGRAGRAATMDPGIPGALVIRDRERDLATQSEGIGELGLKPGDQRELARVSDGAARRVELEREDEPDDHREPRELLDRRLCDPPARVGAAGGCRREINGR